MKKKVKFDHDSKSLFGVLKQDKKVTEAKVTEAYTTLLEVAASSSGKRSIVAEYIYSNNSPEASLAIASLLLTLLEKSMEKGEYNV